jgi:excisionase family DNA binding protein
MSCQRGAAASRDGSDKIGGMNKHIIKKIQLEIQDIQSRLGGLSELINALIEPEKPHSKSQKSPVEALLSDKEASKYLGLTDGTLSVWRSTGRYQIPFIKIGANVRYRQVDLDTWLNERTFKQTP